MELLDKMLREAKTLRELKQAVNIRLKEIELEKVKSNDKLHISTDEEDDLKQVQKWLQDKTEADWTNGSLVFNGSNSTLVIR